MLCQHMGVTEEHQAEVEAAVRITLMSLGTVATAREAKSESLVGR